MGEQHDVVREGCDFRLKSLEDGMKEVNNKISDLPTFKYILEQLAESGKDTAIANREMSKSIGEFNITLVKVSDTMERMSTDQSEMKTDIEGLKQDKADRMIDPIQIQKETAKSTLSKVAPYGGYIGLALAIIYEVIQLIK